MSRLLKAALSMSLGASLAACATAPAPIAAPAAAPAKLGPPPPPQFRLILPVRAGGDVVSESRIDVLMVHSAAATAKLQALTPPQWFAARDALLKELSVSVTPKALRIGPGQGGNYIFMAYEPTQEVIVFADGAQSAVVRQTETVNYRLALTISAQMLAQAP
jgi:hypothetical protein